MRNLKEKIANVMLILFILLCPGIVFSQLSVQTLSIIRRGELPGSEEGRIPSYYSDAILEYRYKWFVAGIRGEGFNSPELEKQYDHISQRYAEFSWSWINARVGNMYEIFGKGLILRGFELPGFIYESKAFRTQQRVIRDFDGVRLRLNPGPLSVTVLSGNTVDPLLPPETEDRRYGDLNGAQASILLPGAVTLGAAYLEYETTFLSKIATQFLSWNADRLLTKLGANDLTFDFYGEYATEDAGLFRKQETDGPYALYLSGNFTWDIWGASLEYKDYDKFDFGINDPPPLVRENTEKLLNRSTHVLNAFSEKGYQIELFVSPLVSTRIIANYSFAENNFSNTFQPLFQERYLGIEYTGDSWALRYFLDSGQDDIVSEVKRFTTGFAPEYTMSGGTTLGYDAQWQRIRRASPPFFDYQFTNFYTAARIHDWYNFSFAFSLERSSDPNVTLSSKYFINSSIGWQPNHHLNLQLFAGERRGGTACDHGYCIQVLDFEGVEFRLETRF